MRSSLGLIALAVLTSGALAQAAPPYAGRWKVNPDKSDFGQLTVLYEALAGGDYKATMDGVSYTFKADGKERPTPWGNTAAWKSINAATWEVVNKVNGKLFSTDTVKLSPDGKTLTIETKLIKASGETSSDRMTLQRVGAGTGLAGKWQAANMKSSSPGSIDISAKGTDGLLLKFVDQNGVCDAKFDGKDVPASGSLWPSGWTCSVTKSGDRAFDLVFKKEGKPMYKSTFTVSEDGKTLTETGGSVNTAEKIKVVYERQ
jgi:hypothetical protein